ncbi:adenylosuccinate synthase [Burkholderia contaminans]|uniref:adenylosuccinate synthase n=1 Tax=Burkholderia contaminans TaxID=488447 RepID=UPI003D6676F5
MAFTHRELCDLAVRWLKLPHSRKGPGCTVAMSEVKGDFNGEVIDALGIRAGVYAECSIVIECKTSRTDYLADAKKPHRIQPERGMGRYRYFMAPEGMLRPTELPAGWGLIEVSQSGRMQPRQGHIFLRRDDPDTWAHPHNRDAEWTLLARMLNRVGNVEVLQNRLKEALNTKTRLAKSSDLMRKKLDDMSRELYLVRSRLEEAGIDSGIAKPAGRARQSHCGDCELNDSV